MAWLQRTVRGFLLVGIVLLHSPSSAEIYSWADESGRMYFTQDLGQIPVQYRADAKARAEAPAGRILIQRYTPPDPPARIDGLRGSNRSDSKGKVHRIRVQRAGSSMGVMVRINDRLDVPFILDTGATDVVLPMWAARELGLAVEGPGVRTSPRSTANGQIDAPVVMLDSVQLGTAVVRNVGGLALKQMDQGLLGLSFFNHFTYNIDAARGIVTLTENTLAADGVLRGGRGMRQWQNEFRSAQKMIEFAESRLDEVPFGRARERTRAEARLEESTERLELLDLEADESHVPFSWRD
jgi:clan AA aspartic protease (TIGR02281 family)